MLDLGTLDWKCKREAGSRKAPGPACMVCVALGDPVCPSKVRVQSLALASGQSSMVNVRSRRIFTGLAIGFELARPYWPSHDPGTDPHIHNKLKHTSPFAASPTKRTRRSWGFGPRGGPDNPPKLSPKDLEMVDLEGPLGMDNAEASFKSSRFGQNQELSKA